MDLHLTQDLQEKLLNWYVPQGRGMPWRALEGQTPNPYYVWLSEIMLQQTTVGTVKDYFIKFTTRWPTLEALSGASLDEVMVAWQGLGYYTRARSLHKCARILVEQGGIFPQTPKELIDLPGIGPYSAASIASIAFNYPIVPVDGNVVRVFARLLMRPEPVDVLKKDLAQDIQHFAHNTRAGDFAQALMDLGATVCTPQKPQCQSCPWVEDCLAYKAKQVEVYPIPSPKPQKQQRQGKAFVFKNEKGEVYLIPGPSQGLLANMWAVPTTNWQKGQETHGFNLEHLSPKGMVRHVFTHIALALEVYKGKDLSLHHLEGLEDEKGRWVHPQDFEGLAISTLMKKVLKAAKVS